jgi:hypothetical protein
MRGNTGEERVIISQNFPQPYVIDTSGTPDISLYAITNQSPNGRVRIFFTDFDLNPLSLVRVSADRFLNILYSDNMIKNTCNQF